MAEEVEAGLVSLIGERVMVRLGELGISIG